MVVADELPVVDVELPLVDEAAVDELDPVELDEDLVAEAALTLEEVDVLLVLLVPVEVEEVMPEVADALALGVIDSTVFLLSTTNCGV